MIMLTYERASDEYSTRTAFFDNPEFAFEMWFHLSRITIEDECKPVNLKLFRFSGRVWIECDPMKGLPLCPKN